MRKIDNFVPYNVFLAIRYQPTEYEHAANCATHGVSRKIYFSSHTELRAGQNNVGETSLKIKCFMRSQTRRVAQHLKSHLRKVEQRFHMCDRMVIYFFIAASYAPWLNLRELGPWAVHMRWLVWIMACAGSAYVFFFHEKNKILDLLCYTAMGAVPAVVLLSVPNREGILELSVGGVFYCLGIVFFKSDGLIPFAHAIWHVFVAVGAGIHYYAIWRYLYATGTGQIKISR
uniref:Monocyte to macrophage differentiation factor 2-like n=1 Tax=Sinocyclocheilus anshuiensis TaxID=1608454 RepID=A0A671SSH4_9TELE